MMFFVRYIGDEGLVTEELASPGPFGDGGLLSMSSGTVTISGDVVVVGVLMYEWRPEGNDADLIAALDPWTWETLISSINGSFSAELTATGGASTATAGTTGTTTSRELLVVGGTVWGWDLPPIDVPWPSNITIDLEDAPAAALELQVMPSAEAIGIDPPPVIMDEAIVVTASADAVPHPTSEAFAIDEAPASLVYMYPLEA